jgi:PAS domain S-box-containing protein
LIFNSCTDLICKLSTDLKILEFNPEAEKFFGMNYNNVVNKSFIQMFVPESFQNKAEKEMNKLLNDGKNINYQMQVISANGNISVVEWTVNILLNKHKMPSGILIISKNITK